MILVLLQITMNRTIAETFTAFRSEIQYYCFCQMLIGLQMIKNEI